MQPRYRKRWRLYKMLGTYNRGKRVLWPGMRRAKAGLKMRYYKAYGIAVHFETREQHPFIEIRKYRPAEIAYLERLERRTKGPRT